VSSHSLKVVSVTDVVLAEQRDHVLIITINRPEVRNAINRAVSQAIAAALDDLDADDGLAVGVITGAGGTFCSGMDLKAFVAGEDIAIPERGLAGIAQRPPRKPMIAAVEGWALAGGCEVALACDLIVAAEDARFGIPEVKRGLIAAAGGLLRLPRRVPPAVAMELALTGEPITAVAAHHFGLVNRLTSSGGALDEALALAASITCNGPLALTVTKQILDFATNVTVTEGFELQQPLVDAVVASHDAREGSVAFAEKRPPVWTGR
jgi:enoyl-CoA hydratase